MWGIPDGEVGQYLKIFGIRDIGIDGAVVSRREKIPDKYNYPNLRRVSCSAIGKL